MIIIYNCVFPEAGSFPVVFNLATGADISTNATCGEVFAESYCKLVNHVKRRPTERIQCGVCDPNSLDPWNHHPVTNAIDGSNHWWQSPTITSGTHYNYVTITLDLKQVGQSASSIISASSILSCRCRCDHGHIYTGKTGWHCSALQLPMTCMCVTEIKLNACKIGNNVTHRDETAGADPL